MTTANRYYRIDHEGKPYLVKASTPAAARAHILRSAAVRVATQDDLLQLVAAGVKPQTAGEEPDNENKQSDQL